MQYQGKMLSKSLDGVNVYRVRHRERFIKTQIEVVFAYFTIYVVSGNKTGEH